MSTLITFVELLPYVGLVLAIIAIVIFYICFENKRNKPVVDETYLENILKALGTADNIIQVSKEHRRIQVELKSTEQVDAKALKALDISAFLTGKKITLLIHTKGDSLLEYIKSKRKEER